MRDPVSRFGKASIDGGGFVPLTTRLVADPWVGSSLFQKAIRRGGRAERAAIPLYRLQGRGNWRRFLVVAFEDAGVASVEVLVETAVTGVEPTGRKGIGGDERALRPVVRPLGDAPKDRSLDRLIGIAHRRPAFKDSRGKVGATSLARQIEDVADMRRPLPERAIVARFASAVECTNGRSGPWSRKAAMRPPAPVRTGSALTSVIAGEEAKR